MISDVLSDACASIKSYQQGNPEMYESLRPVLDKLTCLMDALRGYLDTPTTPESKPRLDNLRQHLADLDISGVEQALNRLA